MLKIAQLGLCSSAIFMAGFSSIACADEPSIEVTAVVKLSGITEDVDTVSVNCDAYDEANEWVGNALTYITTADSFGRQTEAHENRSLHLVDSLQGDLNEVVDLVIEPLGDGDLDHQLYFWSRVTCNLMLSPISGSDLDGIDRTQVSGQDADDLVLAMALSPRVCTSVQAGESAADCVAKGTSPEAASMEILRSDLAAEPAPSGN